MVDFIERVLDKVPFEGYTLSIKSTIQGYTVQYRGLGCASDPVWGFAAIVQAAVVHGGRHIVIIPSGIFTTRATAWKLSCCV